MAYWTVTNIGTNSFTANIYNLENNFTSDNYIRIVWTTKDYGTPSATIGNIFRQELSGIAAKTFYTTFYNLSPGTTYTLYCYAQVNDSADGNKYYRINNNSGGAYISFVTDTEQRVMTAPNEPSLSGSRFEGSKGPNAWIYLSGMTDINARFVWQGESLDNGENFELELDDVDGVNVTAKELTFQSLVTNPNFCKSYRMRLGSIDADDESNQAWSGWATFTTQPSNKALDSLSVSRHGNKVTVKTSALSLYEYTYAEIKKDGSIVGLLEYTSNGSNSLVVDLNGDGIYRFDISVVYRVGSSLLYAVDENGKKAIKTVNISYQRPSKFNWMSGHEPATGTAAANVLSGDWNRLCNNIYNVVTDYMGRDDITIPFDSDRYGNLSGVDGGTVLARTENGYNLGMFIGVGAKIDTDKTLYAWRYNAVNYILCCVNNSDSETDVTNADYAEHFAEGKPVYARYLTALSDKVNGI